MMTGVASYSQRKSKGQMFVAGVVLLIVVLALFREAFVVSPPGIMTTDDLLDNIEKEIRYTAGLSHRLKEDKVANLSAFFRENVNGFEGIYMLVFTEGDDYTLYIGNYLKARIDGSVQASGSSPSSVSFGINDRTAQAFGFDATGNVMLALSYTKGGETLTESLSFDTNGDSAVFYDLMIKENDRMLRRKATMSIT